MQPLSYQTTDRTCWETSMINGILCLLDNGDLCHLYAYRQLQYFVWKDLEDFYVEKHFFPIIGAIEPLAKQLRRAAFLPE